jgi:hypothetical protein
MKRLSRYTLPILAVLVIYVFLPLCCLLENRCQGMFYPECTCSIRGPDVSFVALAATYTLPLIQIKTLHVEEDSDKASILLMMQPHAVFAKNNFSRHIYQTNAIMKGTVQRFVCMEMKHMSRENYYHKNHAEDFNNIHVYSGSSPPLA